MRLPIVNVAHPINRAAHLNAGLVSWWLNLPSGQWGRGTKWRDLSRRSGNDGTLTNTPVWEGSFSRRNGFGSIHFSGATMHVAVTNAASLETSPFTVSAWVYSVTYPGTYNCIIRKGASSAEGVAAMYVKSNKLLWYGNGGPGVGAAADLLSSTASVATGAWSHLVATYSPTVISLYINGVFDSSVGLTAAFLSNNATIRIGSDAFSQYINGYIDDLRVHNVTWAATEVLEYYHESLAGYPTTLNWVNVPYVASSSTGNRRRRVLIGAA